MASRAAACTVTGRVVEAENGPPKRLAVALAGAVQACARVTAPQRTRGMGPSSGLLGGQGSVPPELHCAIRALQQPISAARNAA